MKLAVFLPCVLPALAAVSPPQATGVYGTGVTYQGFYADEIEGFMGIRFAHDTSGERRFKPPAPYHPAPNSTIVATNGGPACPQPLDHNPLQPFSVYSRVQNISEDCLTLNVWRPNGTCAGDKLPVLVFIYGGDLIQGDKDGELFRPGGMILQSVANGHPIMHVSLNYRLGVFGFAQNAALAKEGSQNAGLRDQRLALEWVHDNIAAFGGDPERVTLHGESSGGLSVGMQVMAYGATRPFPFQQCIFQSSALEYAITSNDTRIQMMDVWRHTKCANKPFDSSANIQCLRTVPMKTLLNAQLNNAPNLNNGDTWLPVVDGDFLPAAPSTLISERRIAKNMRAMTGYCEDDGILFVPKTLTTAKDTKDFMHGFFPRLKESHLDHILSLYPPSDFKASHFPNGTVEVPGETYRCSRIVRDMGYVCQPLFYVQALADEGNTVYMYDQNQTLLESALEHSNNYGFGVVHTSELVYVFGNISKYDIRGYAYHPTHEDFRLQAQESGSWASFTATGSPSIKGNKGTLQGWKPADLDDPNYGIFVIGGPTQGYSGRGGQQVVRKTVAAQKLSEKCKFWNSPEIIKELQF